MSTDILLSFLQRWLPVGEWFVAFVAFAAAVTAFITFEGPRSFFFRPRIRPVELSKALHTEGPKKLTYHRLIVKNLRRWPVVAARDVRVWLTYKARAPRNFIPIPLRWTYWGTATRDIARGEPAYLDVLQREEGNAVYQFCWPSDRVGPSESILRNFDPSYCDLQLEFFERGGTRIGVITLMYLPDEDWLKVISWE